MAGKQETGANERVTSYKKPGNQRNQRQGPREGRGEFLGGPMSLEGRSPDPRGFYVVLRKGEGTQDD